MKFIETALAGTYAVELEPIHDERGFFARTWSPADFEQRGLSSRLAQCSISYNRLRGTIRGMHYQVAPHEEEKLVRCTAGAVYDVAVDLRRESESFRRWIAVELSAANRQMLYIPAGVAHGYQTLTDDAEVAYQISMGYAPQSARGVRWDDPAFGIVWPAPPTVISERDRGFAAFEP